MSYVFEQEKPEKLRTDKGSEFVNHQVNRLLNSKNIEHFTTINETKANFAERAIQTIKLKLYKYIMEEQTHKWFNVLQEVTDSYNLSYHRSIKMSPTQAKEADKVTLWKNQYEDKPPTNTKKKRKPSGKRAYKLPYKFQIGDDVKLSMLKRPFERIYDQRWTGEIFTVMDREMKDGIPLYILKDYAGDKIEGKFYENEMQKVEVDENTMYKIEKVIKSTKDKVLVRWLGWGPKFDSWIDKKDFKDYKSTLARA